MHYQSEGFSPGTALAQPWPSLGTALAQPWPSLGTALAQHWLSPYGELMSIANIYGRLFVLDRSSTL